MTELAKKARIAGALYVLLGIVAPVRLMYIPSELFVKGDATATMANIAAHETLFRFGVFTDLLTGVVVLFVAFALYRLFEGVDKALATLLVVLGGFMVTPIYFINAVNDLAVLLLQSGADYLSPFTKLQLDALGMLFLKLHQAGVVVNEVFWGLWLLPMAALFWKSRYIPRFLAVWLVLNGLAYLALAASGVLSPPLADRLNEWLFPAMVGEIATMLWLLIMGAKAPAPTA